MPGSAIALWLVTGGLCFVIGTYLLWRVERSGVRRWGASGSLFGLGDRRDEAGDQREDGGDP